MNPEHAPRLKDSPETSVPSQDDLAYETDVLQPQPEALNSTTAEALGAISVTELMREEQIDSKAALGLARGKVRRAFLAAEKYGKFTPAIASAIAHHDEPSIEVIYPTAEEIKEQSSGARFVSDVLGVFDFFTLGVFGWAESFDGYIETKVEQRVSHMAHKATRAIDTIGSVAAPKAQFIKEISGMHAALLNIESPHDKLPHLAEELATSPSSFNPDSEATDSDDNPYFLLGKLVNLSGTRIKLTGHKLALRAVAPEIMQGIERFLQQQGVEVQNVQTEEFSSLTRRVIHRLAPRKLSNLPSKVEAMLTNIYGVLPEDGARFKHNVYRLCKNIEERSRYGEDGRDLTKILLKDVKDLLS